MTTFARIENGVVAELFSPPAGATIADCFHPELVWVDCTATPSVAPGWTYAGTPPVFAAPPPPPSPTPAQRAVAALAAGCAIVSTSTPALSGTYGIGDQAQADIMAVQTQINAGLGLPSGASTIAWVDAAGGVHAFTAAQFTALAVAISAYVYALKLVVLTNAGSLPAQPVTIA